ncbi:uncharacterized protein [Cherax quadricarinatus]|uniref:uncharacterized protein isoform X2 n=1 Tax=Cherax quadricarinatus TaxID=27406 RepID=UPI00387E8AF8
MESPTTNVKDELGVYTRRVKLLNTDNLSIPILGYSSVKGISAVVQRKCMTRAINNEIKMLDTAYSDMCEKEMGLMLDALWHRGDNRKDYFIMSKVPLTGNKENLVGRFLIQTLKNLNLNYLDVYFLEGPVGLKWRSDAEVMPRYPATGKLQLDMTTDIVKVWLAMETQFYAGRTRFIGLCHFNMDQVSRILEGCNVKPHFIQLDVNAYSMRHSERYSLVKLGINVIATYSLGNPDLQIECMSHPEFPFFEDYNVKYRKIEWSTDTVYKGEHKKKKWLSENYKPPNRVKLEDRRSPPVIPHPVFKKLTANQPTAPPEDPLGVSEKGGFSLHLSSEGPKSIATSSIDASLSTLANYPGKTIELLADGFICVSLRELGIMFNGSFLTTLHLETKEIYKYMQCINRVAQKIAEANKKEINKDVFDFELEPAEEEETPKVKFNPKVKSSVNENRANKKTANVSFKELADEKEKMVPGRRKMVPGRKKMMQGREKMVPGREKRVPGREKMVPGREKMVSGREKRLPGREKMVPSREKRLPGREKRVPGREKRVPGREKRVPGREKMVPSREKRLPGREKRVPGREKRVPGREKMVPSREKRLPGREKRLPGREKRVPGREKMVPGREKMVPGREKMVPGTKKMVPGTKKMVPGRQKMMPGRNKKLASDDAKIMDDVKKMVPGKKMMIDNIDTEVSENIDTEVSHNIDTEVSENIDTEVSHNIDTEVSHNIDTEVSENIDTEVSHNIDTEVSHNIDTEVSENIDTEVSHNIDTEVSENIDTEVSHNIDTEVSHNIDTEVSHNIDTEVSENIDTEVSHNIDTEVSHNIDTEVSENIDTEVSHNIDTEVSHSTDTEASQNIDTEVSHNIDTEVSHNTDTEVSHSTDTEVSENNSQRQKADIKASLALVSQTSIQDKQSQSTRKKTTKHIRDSDKPSITHKFHELPRRTFLPRLAKNFGEETPYTAEYEIDCQEESPDAIDINTHGAANEETPQADSSQFPQQETCRSSITKEASKSNSSQRSQQHFAPQTPKQSISKTDNSKTTLQENVSLHPEKNENMAVSQRDNRKRIHTLAQSNILNILKTRRQ